MVMASKIPLVVRMVDRRFCRRFYYYQRYLSLWDNCEFIHRRTLSYSTLTNIRMSSSDSTKHPTIPTGDQDQQEESSSSDSSSSSDDETHEPDEPEKSLNIKQKAALDKLNSLISTMKVNRTTTEKVHPGKNILLNLAKPLKKMRFPPIERPDPPAAQTAIKSAENEKLTELEQDLGPELTTAARSVAITLGGDVQKTESELLMKLKEYAIETENGKSGKFMSNEVLVGMKIERAKPMSDNNDFVYQRMRKTTSVDGETKSFSQLSPRDKRLSQPEFSERARPLQRISLNIFGSGNLGIFSDKSSEFEEKDKPVLPELKTWDKLEGLALQLSVTHPPANGFEEMIQWTKQNKVWKFPINNEQGLEEEAKVGFQEHVFLEHLLEKRFPSKGPIRHFMELVTTGLSKNPYITVQQKHDHVDWFQKFFDERKDVLKEIGAYDLD